MAPPHRRGRYQSVHLADWPQADRSRGSTAGSRRRWRWARRLTSLGRAARSEASVKVRQPLSGAHWSSCPADTPAILRDIVADELNVDEIDTADELSDVIQFELVPNFRTLGPRLGELVKELRPALAALDGAAAAAALEAGESITVVLGGRAGRAVTRRRAAARPGPAGLCGVPRGRRGRGPGPQPRRRAAQAGLSRDVVRLVQDLRKESGLEVSDRIRLHVVGLDVIAEHFDYIAREVLAVEIVSGPGTGEGATLDLEDDLLDRAGRASGSRR